MKRIFSREIKRYFLKAPKWHKTASPLRTELPDERSCPITSAGCAQMSAVRACGVPPRRRQFVIVITFQTFVMNCFGCGVGGRLLVPSQQQAQLRLARAYSLGYSWGRWSNMHAHCAGDYPPAFAPIYTTGTDTGSTGVDYFRQGRAMGRMAPYRGQTRRHG